MTYSLPKRRQYSKFMTFLTRILGSVNNSTKGILRLGDNWLNHKAQGILQTTENFPDIITV